MFFIRNAFKKDLKDIYELSEVEALINLPNNRTKLEGMLEHSEQSFKNPNKDIEKNCHIFVLEDNSRSKVIGASVIHGKHGTEEKPHFFFRIYKDKKNSSTLNKTITHEVLELDYEPNGYTEIGGLILHPDYRGNKNKLGKQLAYSRFLYMILNPQFFTNTIHTELLPPLDSLSPPPLWEAIGEKFTKMTYDEAHKLSLKSKEFIINLFPWQEKIYCSLLPEKAQKSIGQINKNTRPVKAMLEKIGFEYTREVDPFDGGPHYRCERMDILPIKQAQRSIIKIIEKTNNNHKNNQSYLVSIKRKDYSFYCLKIEGTLNEQNFYVDEDLAEKYQINEGLDILCTPL